WGGDGNAPTGPVQELLGAARRLAGAGGGSVVAAAFGPAAGAARSLIEYGADRVLTVEHDALAAADADAYVDAAEAVCKHVGDAGVGAAVGPAAGAAGSLIEYGADRVLTVEHDALAAADADAYVDAAEAVCKHVGDAVVLIPGDRLGWETAPRLAHRLDAGLV